MSARTDKNPDPGPDTVPTAPVPPEAVRKGEELPAFRKRLAADAAKAAKATR